jgi:uncharacterized protein YjbJ (UPF0337 family)
VRPREFLLSTFTHQENPQQFEKHGVTKVKSGRIPAVKIAVELDGLCANHCVCYRTDCIQFYGYFAHGERWIPTTALRIFVNSRYQESIMNKDQVKGRTEQAKGKVKEVAGKAVGNKELERKGKIENTKGKVQAEYGDVKEDIKDSI